MRKMLKELEERTRRKGWHMSEAGSDGRQLLIVGAHSGDFVWRAAGRDCGRDLARW